MSYALCELDLTQPLPTLTLGAEYTGLGLILRWGDRLIGQRLQPLSTPCTLSPLHLEPWIAETVGPKLLQAHLWEQLQPETPAVLSPSLTVAICTKDRPDNVERLLRSLVPLQLVEGQPQFQILVVDNAPSTPDTQTLVTAWATVDYTCEPKAGLNFARNCAVYTATGDWLAFLDDDVTVDRQWFHGWQRTWADNPDAAAMTGLVLPYELATPAQILFEQRGGFGRGFDRIRYGSQLPGNPLYPCGAGLFGAGCNMAFRRQVLLDLGGFDEALDTGKPLPGGGDLDMFYRVVRAGYPLIYDPQYAVYHQHRRELSQLRHQYWTWGLGFMAFVIKSMDHDPAMAGAFRWLVGWWLQDQLGQLLQSLWGQHVLSPAMVGAELWGGLVGLGGEYGRSQRRIAAIRRVTP